MAEHARLSPSASKRWMACPGAPALEATVPGRSSQASDEGTACHRALEQRIKHGARTRAGDTLAVDGRRVVFSDDMVAWVEEAFAWVNTYSIAHPDCAIYSEERVEVGRAFGCPDDIWGTSDVVIASAEELAIVDAKFGLQDVSPDGNPQLLAYAVGAMYGYGWIHSQVRLVILQPRSGGAKERLYSRDEVSAWAHQYQAAINRALAPDAPRVPSEEACQWCAAAGVCPERQANALAVAQREFLAPGTLPEEHFLHLLNRADEIRAALQAVEDHAADRLRAGGVVAGWKLVEGAKRRVWKDEKKAVALLAKLGWKGDDVWKAPKLLTPAQAEKLVGGANAATLAPLITMPPGLPVLARESDARPALDPSHDFKLLGEDLLED